MEKEKIEMKRNVWMLAAVAATGLAGRSAMADDFMNINFSGDTIGLAPAVTYPSAPSPVNKPYAIGGYSQTTTDEYGDNPPTLEDGTVVVGNAGTMSKAAVMTTNTANNQTGALWLDTQYLVTANQFRISFDVDVLGSAPTINADPSFLFNLNGDTSNKVGLVFAVNQFSAAGSVFSIGAAPTSGDGGLFGFRDTSGNFWSFPAAYQNNETYHIEIDGDFATQTVSAYVDGTLAMSNFSMRGGKTSNLLTETFLFVDAQPDYANSVAFDNIRGAAVPLPSAAWGGLGLIGVMGATSGVKRLRKQTA